MTIIRWKNQLKKIQNHDRMNLGRFSTDSEYLRNKSCKAENLCNLLCVVAMRIRRRQNKHPGSEEIKIYGI